MKSKKALAASLLAISLVLTSCGSAKYDEVGSSSPSAPYAYEEEADVANMAMEASTRSQMAPESPQAETEEAIDMEQKLIKTASLSIEVDDYATSRARIDALAAASEAYVSNEQEYNSGGYYSNTITIRVKSQNFDSLVVDLLEVAEVVHSKNIDVMDVTEEFVDIQTRLKNKRAAEQRYVEILQEARNVGEILQVEEQLRVLREEIEAKEGRLKFLQNQVGFSTITLTISQFRESTYIGFGDKIGDGFRSGWNGLLDFVVGLVTAWPALLMLGGLGYLFFRWMKRRRSNS